MPIVAGVLVEHGCFVEWRFAFRNLATPVDRERLIEPVQQIRPSRRHEIVHAHRADDRGKSA
jgi:hypothetical protein